MHRLIAIALIFILSAHCLYRLGMFTYFQIEYAYISKVWCVNKDKPITQCKGKCFLATYVFDDDFKEKNPAPKAEKIELTYFIVQSALIFSLHRFHHPVQTNTRYQQMLSLLFVYQVFQPPE